MTKEELSKMLERASPETKAICEGIEQMGDSVSTKIKTLERKYEDRFHELECRGGTQFGQKSFGPGSMREEIANYLGQHTEGLHGLLEGSTKNLRIETKTVGDMLISTNLSGGTASINNPVLGPVGMTWRLNNVQDLLRQTTMTGSKIPVLKDNGGEGVPLPVAEGNEKPSVDFDLVEADAPAQVIAATTTVSKQFMEDIPNAIQWLSGRLTELWQAAFNDQLLNGNGTPPNLKGLNYSGNFTAADGDSTVHLEQLIQGILQMRILKRRPSGIIVNPANIETLILNKAEGSGEYDSPNSISISPVGQLMVMGVPVVDVAEQPADTFTLHDNTGSLLAWRNMLSIEFFNEIYAKTNKILIRIEARAALPIYGSTYTIKGTFAGIES
jgi:hypothetical protein